MVSASLLRRGRGWALNRGRGLGDRSHRPSVAEDDNIHPFGGFRRGDLADEFQPVHHRHVDIAQDEVDYIALQRRQRFAPFAASTTFSSSMPA